jgi:hypothetical protein
MSASILVELDKWGERGSIRAESLEDGSSISLGFRTNGNNKIVFSRNIQLGNFAFTVFIGEYRNYPTTFSVRASASVATPNNNANAPRRASRRKPIWRERPLKPVYLGIEEVHWPLDRTGVFAGFPEKWDEEWANFFIKETLDLLRSPEVPKHYELHRDYPEGYEY